MAELNGKNIFLVGLKGDDGKSAYEIACEHGFEGSEDEWLASLGGGGITVVKIGQTISIDW